AAVLLVLDQTKNLLGLAARGGGEDHFLVRFWLTLSEGGAIHAWTLAIGLGTIAVALGLRWLNHLLGVRVLPELLLAVVGAAGLVALTDPRQTGVRVLGEIPRSLPTFQVPTA